MASSHQNAQPAEEPIEPDDNIPATVDDQQYYEGQRPYWYRICPGGFQIPPPLPPSSEQHQAFPHAQGPPVDGGPVEAQPASDQLYQATPDHAPDIYQEPTACGPQTGATDTHRSPEPTTASQDGIATPRSNPEPQTQDRQRCEVWPLTYRTANGWLKVFWCVQIDGESNYIDQPPDLQELSRRYHLVYFPDLASHEAQLNQ
ncbi:uncharacterized protein B0H64DRAFT_370967 [Chaetomium fimeti]|jgi:hypothetical protein|uniref:Uncharacterized protein n=1 Tax=Chaetomium fimeti TaxID=1854472 RepID=A0AAE0HKY7_9PEZI|nr:hypothetical protein B0H64DRAFT_370967 [Chaetomium fimeti]